MQPDFAKRFVQPKRSDLMNDVACTMIPGDLRKDAGPLVVPVPGTLWLEIDLRATDYVNLNFHDHAGRSVPLHLSLRRDAQQIVANRWAAKGWRRELAMAAPLRRAVHALRLDFRMSLVGATVALSLDGAHLRQLDALPILDLSARFGVRRGFSGLGDLGAMTWPEGLRSLRVTACEPKPILHLTSRLELGLVGAHAQAVCDLEDCGPPVRFIPLETSADANGLQTMHALLPGRIWAAQGSDTVTLIARDVTGAEIARARLSRADILHVLRRPEMPWMLRHDTLLRLQVLEHVHFAQLWPDLPEALGPVLAVEAARQEKAGFAPPHDSVVSVAHTSVPVSSACAACDAFHRAIGAGQEGDPVAILHQILQMARLDPLEARQFFLMLSEWFCLNADPRDLTSAAQIHGVMQWDDITETWAQIAALPMLWINADWAGCLRVLQRARKVPPGWVVTPALGWLASTLAQGGIGSAPITIAQRTGLMAALMELVVALAPAHMSQMSCHRLIAGICDLLDQAGDMPDWWSPRLSELSVRAYGLNTDFWQQLDARGGTMPAQLADWRKAFDNLQQALAAGDHAGIARAARPYFARPVAGQDILRRLVIPEGAIRHLAAELPEPAKWAGCIAQDQMEEAALRWLAFPRSDTARAALALTTEKAIHKSACAGLRAAAVDIPRPLMSGAMRGLGQSLQVMLDQIRAGRVPTTAELAAITRRAGKLAVPEAEYLGLAALLALAEALAHTGSSHLAHVCLDAVEAAQPDRPAATRPVVAQALARFDALCPDPTLRAKLPDTLAPDPRLAPPPCEDDRARHLRMSANPFADTLVALISCRAYLSTRVPAIKTAWGEDLAVFGIPIITVVGRAPDQRPGCGHRFDGQLLELDAPDDYEGLPQKILALADWVLAQTGFGRVFKIDDDCFLNVGAFFTDPAFLTVPYYGRPLLRKPGEMDRAWHMGRSQGARGRMELDKSPEPSLYADGGSGYVLSRQALVALMSARRTVHGQTLEQVSFMEDKLVGDLLAVAGVPVAGPNHDIAIFRKTMPAQPAVAQYQNSFLPFAGANIKLAHLDSGGESMTVCAALDNPWPSQMKIWPCHMPARLGWAKNALDLISPSERLEQARDADVAVISVMRNERFMLDHFLSHYRRLGVTSFLIVDNGSDDGTLEHLLVQPDVSVFSTDTPYSQSAYGVMWQEALLAQVRLGRWTLIADADELAFWSLPGADGLVHGDLPALLRGADFAHADAVRLLMFDLYPKGPMSEAGFGRSPFLDAGYIDRVPLRDDWQGRGPWSNCATVTSALRHRLMEEAGAPARANLFVAQKFALLRYHPFMRLSTGLHYIAGARLAARDMGFAHFKYHAQFHAKARAEVARAQHFNNAEEYRNYLRLHAEGRDVLFDPAQSLRFAQCPAVRAVCGEAADRTVAAFRPSPTPRAFSLSAQASASAMHSKSAAGRYPTQVRVL